MVNKHLKQMFGESIQSIFRAKVMNFLGKHPNFKEIVGTESYNFLIMMMMMMMMMVMLL